jgi:hypothetical protein
MKLIIRRIGLLIALYLLETGLRISSRGNVIDLAYPQSGLEQFREPEQICSMRQNAIIIRRVGP